MFGDSEILKEFQNEPDIKHTFRIDTKLLAKIETEEGESKDEAAPGPTRIDCDGRQARPGRRTGAVRGLCVDAHRRLGCEHRDAHPGHQGI